MFQPGTYQDGSLGAQSGSYHDGSLGILAQPGATNDGSLGTVAAQIPQPRGLYSSGGAAAARARGIAAARAAARDSARAAALRSKPAALQFRGLGFATADIPFWGWAVGGVVLGAVVGYALRK